MAAVRRLPLTAELAWSTADPPARPSLCVVGDALLDVDWDGAVQRVCRDAPAPVLDTPTERARPGGAALAAALAAASGAEVTLVTALGADDGARRLADLLAAAQVEVVDLGLDAPTPVKLRLRAEGHSIARVDRGCEPVVPPGPWTGRATAAVRSAGALLVSDYGRGLAAVRSLAEAALARRGPTVWDPHSLGPRPAAATTVATPNLGEAHALVGGDGPPPDRLPDLVALAAAVSASLGCPAAVTAGPLGAVLADGRSLPTVVPTTPVRGDVCGAGDRMAASTALALAGGATVLEAVQQGVADARAYVAAGDAAPGPPPRPGGAVVDLNAARDAGDPETGGTGDAATAQAVGRAGGVVVAAGGCFDVLHAGHVQLLDQARRMGDHLVVCLNSDRSVRRLKGPGRPLNTAADRAAVLRSLASVDGVVVFDEDTPTRALEDVRPHLFVKGADYLGVDLAEREVLARWGGHVVLLPLVAGRSTTRIIATAAQSGA
ncbi:MAG TPA: PfkB family carbohydrate kinase [Acidimicrobiales bacterium]